MTMKLLDYSDYKAYLRAATDASRGLRTALARSLGCQTAYVSQILNGGAQLSLEQAEAIAEAAVEECERFYPVFQFVLWGGKAPGEAIAAALIDTHGEA